MTEAEWLSCSEPEAMLDHFATTNRVSDRKLRLFAVACIRQTSSGTIERELETVEQYVDGKINFEKLQYAFDYRDILLGEGLALLAYPPPMPRLVTAQLCRDAAGGAAVRTTTYHEAAAAKNAARTVQCHLFRDIFGNPFRPPLAAEPSWRATRILAIAQAVYDQRSFDRLSELAEALEDAGCDDAELLGHLRSPGPHVRGALRWT
jgi:hypothetical protein